jgi:hypothetical protein
MNEITFPRGYGRVEFKPPAALVSSSPLEQATGLAVLAVLVAVYADGTVVTTTARPDGSITFHSNKPLVFDEVTRTLRIAPE